MEVAPRPRNIMWYILYKLIKMRGNVKIIIELGGAAIVLENPNLLPDYYDCVQVGFWLNVDGRLMRPSLFDIPIFQSKGDLRDIHNILHLTLISTENFSGTKPPIYPQTSLGLIGGLGFSREKNGLIVTVWKSYEIFSIFANIADFSIKFRGRV